MIPTDKPSFLACLHSQGYMYQGYIYADTRGYVVAYPQSVNPDYYNYTDEDLAAADHRLPKVIAKLCRQYKHSSLPLSAVMNTIEFWKNPLFLNGIDGEKYAIRSVQSVDSIDRAAGIVSLSIQSYHHFRAGSYVYVTSPEEATISVTLDELEKCIPGWLVRFDVLGVLENDNEDLLKTLFQSQPKVRKSTKVAMADISFD